MNGRRSGLLAATLGLACAVLIALGVLQSSVSELDVDIVFDPCNPTRSRPVKWCNGGIAPSSCQSNSELLNQHGFLL